MKRELKTMLEDWENEKDNGAFFSEYAITYATLTIAINLCEITEMLKTISRKWDKK